MYTLLHHLRYTFRQLYKSPGFAVAVIGTLGLCVGMATAIFGLLYAVILRPLPFNRPDLIVNVQTRNQNGYPQPDSWPSYLNERDSIHSFQVFAAYNNNLANLETLSGTVRLRAITVTDNFFDVFAVKPILGRTFLPGEQNSGTNDVVVLSYEVWKRFFAGQTGIIGSQVNLDGVSNTVIGVMPDGFRFPLSARDTIYRPIHIDKPIMLQQSYQWLGLLGRLREGASLKQAQSERQHILNDLDRSNQDSSRDRFSSLARLDQAVDSKAKGPLWVLLSAVLALLAIGCVNITGLLLARGVRREHEMSILVALGASRSRLLQQMLTEGVVLGLLGAATGLLVSWALLEGMKVFLIQAFARGPEIHLNWMILCTAIAISVISSSAATLYPSLRLSRNDHNHALKTGGRTGTARSQYRLRTFFVVIQVALTLVLLIVSNMLVRLIVHYKQADLGFDPTHILIAHISIPEKNYRERDVITDFYNPVLDRVQRLPGVLAAGITNMIPIDGRGYGINREIHIAGQPTPSNRILPVSELRYVSEGYLDAMGIRLCSGRMLNSSLDRESNKAGTVVVNEAFVHQFFPSGQDPVGQRIDDADTNEGNTQIVGVITDVRQSIYERPMPEMDYLTNELTINDRIGALTYTTLAVRVDGDPRQVIPALRNIFRDIDPRVAFDSPEIMTDVLSDVLILQRMESWSFGIFSGLALVLVLAGMNGLISNEVNQSRRDLGVHMALGATRSHILKMVLGRVLKMVGLGVAGGLVLALCTRKLIGMVIYFEVQREASSLALAALFLLAAGIVAVLVPAIRAITIRPTEVLRSE